VTVTKQIPAGTTAALGTNPVNPVGEEYNVVEAAPAGPEPAASATTLTSAVAPAPRLAPANRTRASLDLNLARRLRSPGTYHRSGQGSRIELASDQRGLSTLSPSRDNADRAIVTSSGDVADEVTTITPSA
jgi:hypothetical protein